MEKLKLLKEHLQYFLIEYQNSCNYWKSRDKVLYNYYKGHCDRIEFVLDNIAMLETFN